MAIPVRNYPADGILTKAFSLTLKVAIGMNFVISGFLLTVERATSALDDIRQSIKGIIRFFLLQHSFGLLNTI